MGMKNLAREWRENQGYVGKGGVIIIFQDNVQGWVNELSDPQSWIPGCIAVDDEG